MPYIVYDCTSVAYDCNCTQYSTAIGAPNGEMLFYVLGKKVLTTKPNRRHPHGRCRCAMGSPHTPHNN